MKLPRLSGREVTRALERAGFVWERQRGSHVILTRMIDGRKTGVVVPLHAEIDTGTLLSIIRQAKLTRDGFLRLLR